MFKVVEKICDEPLRMLAKPGVKFRPGFVVKLVELGGDMVCDLADEKNALGIAGSRLHIKDESLRFEPKSMLKVWAQRMVFRTDLYDKTHEMCTGMSLFVSDDGLLTTGKPEGTKLYVAKLISPPDEEHAYLEALWL